MTPVENDPEAFLAVVEAHKGILYKIARAYCPDAEDRKDLVQEILVQVWKAFPRYDGRCRHSTWIYRIALNVAISNYRRQVRGRHLAHPITRHILEMAGAGPADPDPDLERLHRFIAELKELDKALVLLYLDEKSHREMAAIMGMTETNVATRISRIKDSLRQKFATIQT